MPHRWRHCGSGLVFAGMYPMTEQHPITPPPELVRQWSIEAEDEHQPTVAYSMVSLLAAKAARWGSDQELEACEKYWMTHGISPQGVVAMRYARRPQPKPPSKEEALDQLFLSFDRGYLKKEAADIIRRALEQLDD
jgi:hypothetical protein